MLSCTALPARVGHSHPEQVHLLGRKAEEGHESRDDELGGRTGAGISGLHTLADECQSLY